MTILIDNTIDTVRSTIYGIDLVSELQNAYNEANGAFARANVIDGIASLAIVTDSAHPGLTVNSGVATILTANGTFLLGANAATTGAVGVVQLNDTVQSTSATQAATANSVNTTWAYAQSAFNLANTLSGSSGLQTLRFTALNGLTVNGGSFLVVTTASNTVNFSTNTATTGAVGVVQLTDSQSSTSTTTAATPNSVKLTNDAAQAAFLEANSFQSVINSAFAEANSFQSVINSSFTLANTVNLMTPMYNPGNNVINFGGKANTRGIESRVAYANGNFANIGDAQWAITLLRNTTSGAASIVNLSSSGANSTVNLYGSINQLQLANNAIYAFSGMVAARDTTNMACKVWEVKGGIKNVVGPPNTTPLSNTNIIGTPIINIIAADNGTNNWTVGLGTDLANNALLITATGATNLTNWVAQVQTVEVA